MKKSELIEQLAARKEISIITADRIVDEIIDGMANTLVADGRIEIRGFGSFENKKYAGYTGRNPKTGKLIAVKPKKSPLFKVGKELRERLQEG